MAVASCGVTFNFPGHRAINQCSKKLEKRFSCTYMYFFIIINFCWGFYDTTGTMAVR